MTIDCTEDYAENGIEKYPDLQNPSKQELMAAVSVLIRSMQNLDRELIDWHRPDITITGRLAVMHYCPDRLPSIVRAMQFSKSTL